MMRIDDYSEIEEEDAEEESKEDDEPLLFYKALSPIRLRRSFTREENLLSVGSGVILLQNLDYPHCTNTTRTLSGFPLEKQPVILADAFNKKSCVVDFI